MATAIPENHAAFDLEEVCSVTGGTSVGSKGDRVVGVVTDSRQVQAGNLFVALRGERFDGHDYLDQAIAAGAGAVLVEAGASVPGSVAAVEVQNTLDALGALARAHRVSWGGHVVGITGSVGKTTTKDFMAAALAANGKRVLKTKGNLNNLIGVPMTLFELGPDHDTAVIEMGTSQPGEIPRLAEIASPDDGIVTRAALAHTQGLGSVEAVADEKMSLLAALGADGCAVYYGDDRPLAKRASVLSAKRKLSYGRAAENDIRVLEWALEGDQTKDRLQVRGDAVEVRLRMLGEGAVLNAAGAVALTFGLGLSVEDGAAALQNVEPPPGRMCARQGAHGRLILDDTYNANPASMRVAISAARTIAEERQAPLVVLFGDMKELGEHSEDAHRELGEQVSDAGTFLFIGCGREMRTAIDVAKGRGVATLSLESSADSAGLSDRIPRDAVVLIKGSRSMRMERCLEPLGVEGSQ